MNVICLTNRRKKTIFRPNKSLRVDDELIVGLDTNAILGKK